MTIRTPYWLENGSFTADDDRLTLQSLLGGSPNQSLVSGVIGLADYKVAQTGTASMNLTVTSGAAWVDGSQSATEGVYAVYNDDNSQTVTISTANGSNPRIDLVVLQVRNSVYSGAHDDAILTVIKGTAAASPSPPALPADALLLAQILVGTSVTSITTANITDKRSFFAPLNLQRGTPSGTLIATAQTIVATGGGSDTVIALTALAGSLKGGMTLSSNGLLIATPGNYRIGYQLMWQASSGGVTASGEYFAIIEKNGTAVFSSMQGGIATQNPSPGGSVDIPLAAGDLINLAGFQNSGSPEASAFTNTPNPGNLTWLSATLVSD